MYFDWDDVWIWLIGAVSVFLLGCLIVASIHEERRWQEFKVAHACKVVGHMDGELVTGVGPGSNGGAAVTIGSTSDKDGWLCDDGMTYWKNR